MIPTVTILMVTHTLEVIVCSLAYWICAKRADPVSPSFNYAALGYGDIAPVQRWRLLRAIPQLGRGRELRSSNTFWKNRKPAVSALARSHDDPKIQQRRMFGCSIWP